MYFDKRLWRMMRGARWRLAAQVAAGLVAAGVGIARFVFLGWLLARVFEGAGAQALMLPAAGVAAAVLLRGALEHVRTMIAHVTAARIQEILRGELYDKVAELGPAWFAGARTGGVMLSLTDGVEQLQTFFGQYLPQLCIAGLTPLAIFAFIAWWDVPVAGVMVAAALLGLVLPMLFHRLDRRASLARQRSFKAFGAELLDAIQGLATLKAFGQSAAYGRMLAKKSRELADSTMWVLATSTMTRGVTDVTVAVGAAAALGLGAYRVSHGLMGLTSLLIVLMAGTEIFRPLRDLRAVLHQGMVGQAAASGINELLATPAPMQPSFTLPPVALSPTIAFEDVRFSYPGGRRAALDGLSFTVAAGECLGIVGPSGGGKSTITRLLLRLYDPQEGKIAIGGHDLRTLDPERVRREIALVQQDTTLFHGTVEENLRLGKPDASSAEIEAAARAANAQDFIEALPSGYATLIGERGAKLSGGQRQRLAIARALLRDAPILILDEALSSVDAENEAIIQEALDRLMAGRTTLILAHRLSSVIGADRILVLEEGRIAESGTHDELIRREGPYRRLMGAQAEATGPAAAAPAERAIAAAPVPDLLGHVEGEGEPADAILRAEGTGLAKTLATLTRFILPWRGQLAATVLSGVGRVAAFIGVGVIGALIVAAVKQGSPYVTLLILLALLAPLAGVLHWLESWLAHDMAYRLLAHMRIALFAKLDALAPAYLLRRRSGDLVALATQDVETVEFFYAHTVAPALVALLVPATVLATLAALAWPTALALLPFLLYVGLAPLFLRRRIDRLGAFAREGLGRMTAHIADTIQGLSELVAFQAVARRRASFMELVRAYDGVRLEFFRDLSRQAALLEVATGLGGLAVALAGAFLATEGGLAPTLPPLLTLLAVAAFLPVSEIANVGRQLADTFASARRLQAVESEPVTVKDGAAMPAPPQRGGSAIRFDRVSFAYPGASHRALTEVSLAIAPGGTAALVGPSGAGKTTAANLLLRFWDPSEGAITLDGLDLRDYALDHLRRRIALVAQDTYLFNDTLRANVRLARPEAAEEEIALAVERAALAEFVESLPEGLDTRVGERGVQLSGGQRQRVAIARAFLKNAPVLILDEATSHLDAISEAQVRAALAALMRDRTTIVIAHRLSTVRAADLIAVLDGGRLVETGTHASLLARGGLYAALVERQLGLGRAAE
ncbi:MAG TPA: ABC transporter ATP-binding protein [Alphaproteobacteria bacterium]|nr:ABC transporter ATP-binding protein [Alphaproteobacteria bacterium]